MNLSLNFSVSRSVLQRRKNTIPRERSTYCLSLNGKLRYGLWWNFINCYCTHQFPLDGLEEGVRHDLHEAGLLVATQPVGRVLVEEALQDGGRLYAQRPRDPDRLLQDH